MIHLIAQKATAFTVAPGDVRTVGSIGGISASGGEDGRATSLNDHGVLVFYRRLHRRVLGRLYSRPARRPQLRDCGLQLRRRPGHRLGHRAFFNCLAGNCPAPPCSTPPTSTATVTSAPTRTSRPSSGCSAAGTAEFASLRFLNENAASLGLAAFFNCGPEFRPPACVTGAARCGSRCPSACRERRAGCPSARRGSSRQTWERRGAGVRPAWAGAERR